MSTDIIQNIKDIAHKVSEDYIFTKKGMNDSLVESYLNGEIDNDEILKRICEHANQNVYLAIFNDPTSNKANIVFEIADFNKIIPIIRESEKAMNDLGASPIDFRSSLSSAVVPKLNPAPRTYEEDDNQGEEDEQTAEMQSNVEKSAMLQGAVEYRNMIQNFVDKIALLKGTEEKNAEAAFNKMADDTKMLIAKDDSIGDISKIAARFVKESGYPCFMKVAEAYDIIHKSLINNNFYVKTEFTKLSSMKINTKAEVLKPINEFANSLSKIAGFDEMHKNASLILDVFNKYIKQELKK